MCFGQQQKIPTLASLTGVSPSLLQHPQVQQQQQQQLQQQQQQQLQQQQQHTQFLSTALMGEFMHYFYTIH